ncbi:hypothetical protein ACQEU8_19115 [Streptomyces sp. CA-250714]|uniref:hypothetical protein n=1 Tax=Streptomyces sp. CA-250714 TaxID=3240060 RepID=UPI003D9368CC
MVTLAIRTAQDAPQREGTIPADALPPDVQPDTARAGKPLRAGPVAQQWWEDRKRPAADLPELVSEWANSPGGQLNFRLGRGIQAPKPACPLQVPVLPGRALAKPRSENRQFSHPIE